MSDPHIRKLSNKLKRMKLFDIEGEAVPVLTSKIAAIACELDGSDNAPNDLLTLVSTPFTKGNAEMFTIHAMTISIKFLPRLIRKPRSYLLKPIIITIMILCKQGITH